MTPTLRKPIRTCSPLKTPEGLNRAAIESWVRRWTTKRIRLDTSDFAFVGNDNNQEERARVLRFAVALQKELVHFEGWGTPRS